MQEKKVQSLGWEDPLEEDGDPLQYSCLENPVGRGARQAAVLSVTFRVSQKVSITERLSNNNSITTLK